MTVLKTSIVEEHINSTDNNSWIDDFHSKLLQSACDAALAFSLMICLIFYLIASYLL